MSLIAYYPQEGREIVLRHRDAIVVRDSTSHRLEIRGLTECPTCHRPMPRAASADDPYSDNTRFETAHESYVNPDYFRMLQAAAEEAAPRHETTTRSALGDGGSQSESSTSTGRVHRGPGEVHESMQPWVQDSVDSEQSNTSEFVSSNPGVPPTEGNRIRKQAFSPGYFETFFKEEKVLGRGGKGVVLLVRHEIDKCDLGHFACKRVPVGDDHGWLEKVLSEVGLLNRLSHPNLVSYRHVWLESAQITRFGPSVACAFILQQYCNGGDLHQYLVGSAPREATKEELKAQMRRRSKGQAENPHDLFGMSRRLSFDEIYSLFKDITSGVAYLHSNNFIHRDLKPSNCLLHSEGGTLRCLISDFGEVQPENVMRKSTGSTGTISYCAPEVLKSDERGQYANFTTKSDIFSLGMILYFMCFGTLPYRSANALQEELEDIDELRAEISDWQGFEFERRERPDLPSRLYKLLKKLLSRDPAERPGASEVLAVMRHEHVFEPVDRAEQIRGSPLNRRGANVTRVQNLDSPARSGTPDLTAVSEPGLAEQRNDNSHSSDVSSLRTHAMTVTKSQEGYSDRSGASSLPTSSSVSYTGDTATAQNQDHEREQQDSPRLPLLMAPPRTRTEELRYRTQMYLFWFLGLIGLHEDVANRSVRMGLFIIKLMTLTRPCWPYMVKVEMGIPLVVMAVMDFRDSDVSGWLVTRHNNHGHVEFGSPPWHRGLMLSLVLLAVHFLLLWLAHSWEALCVKPDW
ncbi:Serine/threonine protein kinase [Geosmithia morbida]|uniref:non-specific serine/threonine protein kinase n=1 Tax=Geosmithia morbida TaxID=1094350 RepID=A0A9P4YNU3_9HYPO|nr:Serine/threonine protein kinase [Geosmithia morbida]KAF4120383.1 Serine/threonine protein kinase [Geosmithia morbida]